MPGADPSGAVGDSPGKPAGAGANAEGGLAGALAAALSQRKKKVSASGEFPIFPFVKKFPSTNDVQTMRKTTTMIGEA